ncbi:MAG: hypothetical protein ACREQW_21825 [Candidatus Binatia bacterium]
MDQSTYNWITALGGLVAAIASLWSAHAARRSADTANLAAQHAEQIERRSLLRSLLVAAQGVISEYKRIEALVAKVKGEIKDNFIFAGQTGASPRKDMFLKRADERIDEVAPYVSEARSLVDNPNLQNSSDEDLTRALARFEGFLAESRRVREDLERELSSLEADNRLYRERRIS